MILIFANGEMETTEWLRPLLAQAELVIAANGGTRHLLALDARPDLVIGDMDSLPPGIEAGWTAQGTRFLRRPPEKDQTDLELALLHATAEYSGPVYILAALGGRLDQTLANMLLLAHPALIGREVFLLTEYQRAWLLTGRTTIHGRAGDLVSLIPLGGDALVAETAGLAWPLHDELLLFGPARGVSNVMTADEATVVVASGRLLCVHTGQFWKR